MTQWGIELRRGSFAAKGLSLMLLSPLLQDDHGADHGHDKEHHGVNKVKNIQVMGKGTSNPALCFSPTATQSKGGLRRDARESRTQSLTRAHSLLRARLQVVEFGRFEMDTWYHSPYPEPYALQVVPRTLLLLLLLLSSLQPVWLEEGMNNSSLSLV